ncbi:hypothetical protein SRHO_G00082800 [Serrasalmus rhombeus]
MTLIELRERDDATGEDSVFSGLSLTSPSPSPSGPEELSWGSVALCLDVPRQAFQMCTDGELSEGGWLILLTDDTWRKL